jgi:hypothetical protein
MSMALSMTVVAVMVLVKLWLVTLDKGDNMLPVLTERLDKKLRNIQANLETLKEVVELFKNIPEDSPVKVNIDSAYIFDGKFKLSYNNLLYEDFVLILKAVSKAMDTGFHYDTVYNSVCGEPLMFLWKCNNYPVYILVKYPPDAVPFEILQGCVVQPVETPSYKGYSVVCEL